MEWLFFDCFNTLLDDFDVDGDESGLGSLPALAVTLGACTAPHELVAAYHAERVWADPEYRERSLDARLASALRRLGRLSRQQEAAALKQLLARWHAEYPASLRLTPGVREMLAHWQGRRRMAVVSNFFVAGLPIELLRRFGLADFFEFVIDSASLGFRKPGARIFQAALDRAGTAADQVTFIGDRLDLDIIPAHALGMRVLHLDRSTTRPGLIPRDARFPAVLHHDQFRADEGLSVSWQPDDKDRP